MKSKHKRSKFYSIIIALLGVGITVFVVWFAVGAYVVREIGNRDAEIGMYYQYSEMLGREAKILVTSDLQLANLPANLSLLNEITQATNTLPDLEREIGEITDKFTADRNTFIEWADKHSKAVPSLVATLELDQEVDFAVKKSSDGYFQEKYAKLRTLVKDFNIKNKSDVVWQYDVEREVQAMTLREKLAQMFIVTVDGGSLNSNDAKLIQSGISGVILMGGNISSGTQVKQLTNDLQDSSPLYPLFVATDQEGGAVKRIWWDNTPGQRLMADLATDKACSNYQQRSALLQSLGINLNFGIVADITSNNASFIYNRTFSDRPAKAAEMVKLAVKCTDQNANTLKHFPGHGRTELDTHKVVASYNTALEEWEKSDLLPFKSGIAEGVDFVMTGHLIYTPITGKQPASLSASAVEYLRKDLGFKGLIVTDDMGMLSADRSRDPVKDLLSALQAGNDLVLYVQEPIAKTDLVKKASDLVTSGKLDELLIDKTITRLLIQKQQLL